MKTLLTAGVASALQVRLGALTPAAHRRWGKMSVGGMLCHLGDAYSGLLQRGGVEEPLAPFAGRYLLRPFALHVPVHWPHRLPTPPEVDQLLGGTSPGEFFTDRSRLAALLDQFAATRDFAGRRHPLFGPLSEREWLRWAWLHADHHLRQFSA